MIEGGSIFKSRFEVFKENIDLFRRIIDDIEFTHEQDLKRPDTSVDFDFLKFCTF